MTPSAVDQHEQFRARHDVAVENNLASGVRAATLRKYHRSWMLWRQFVRLDHKQPSEADFRPAGLSLDYLAIVLQAFISYLGTDLLLSHLNIDAMCSGLRFLFKSMRIPTGAFDSPAQDIRTTPGIHYSWVRTLRITIGSAKNQLVGTITPLWFSAETPASQAASSTDEQSLHFTETLFNWALRSTFTATSLFCSYVDKRGAYVPLSYALMRRTIKSCARAFGFDPRQFASHSWRIGGASQLAAHRAPPAQIQALGRCARHQFASIISTPPPRASMPCCTSCSRQAPSRSTTSTWG